MQTVKKYRLNSPRETAAPDRGSAEGAKGFLETLRQRNWIGTRL